MARATVPRTKRSSEKPVSSGIRRAAARSGIALRVVRSVLPIECHVQDLKETYALLADVLSDVLDAERFRNGETRREVLVLGILQRLREAQVSIETTASELERSHKQIGGVA